MELDLPSPKEVSSFISLAKHDATEAFLPIYTADMSGSPVAVIAFLWYSSGKTRLVIYNKSDDRWNMIEQTARSNHVFHDVENYIDTSVILVGEDIDSELDLYYRLKDEIRDNYYSDLPDEYTEVGEDEVDLCDNIKCSHDARVERPSDEIPAKIESCRVCNHIHAVTFDGEKADREDFFNINWLREKVPDSLVWETDGNLVGLVSPEESNFSWIDVALYVLGQDADDESRTITGYESDVMSGVVIGESQVSGYAAWNRSPDEEEIAMLRQVYVRPTYREQNIATNLVEIWWNHMPDDHFYVADPNSVGRTVIESLGYYDTADREMPIASDTRVIRSLGLPSFAVTI
ncbi:hypothetical protein SAMN05444422_101474 [Halobiforma haloterrestris]|uniref:Uncharacterized protein n=1 Tax=Natronobacterium haloterrestre TaxID=148448 RepID=A0A1I1DGL0_NATHA|nr:GNAT family N-acetyltransferase [Halobiforma haloterrestris]SFB72198.1 hypothetical protein SAMN05444422_101474 [Halobiforma haloterrestris]